MVQIDMLGNYFGSRGSQAGSFSVVIRRMAEHMAKISDLFAWSIGGTAWERKQGLEPALLGALQAGNRTTKGRAYDHIGIIHGHPAHYDAAGREFLKGYHSEIERYKKKILMTVNESEPIPQEWVDLSQIFDQIWVPSKYCYDVWSKQLPGSDIRIVPHGVESFMRPSPNIVGTMENPTLMMLDADPKFKFLNMYTVTSYPHRKGIDILLKAYMTEFDGVEDVSLVIKTENRIYLQEMINREALEHDAPPKIQLIDQDFSVTELVQLYNSCNTYLSIHRGEAWALDVSNAIGCGLPTICTNFGGPVDYMPRHVKKIPIHRELVPGVCYSSEGGKYAEPILKDVMELMRENFKDGSKKNGKLRKQAIDKSHDFRKKWSWENSAKIAVQCCEELA